MSAKGRQTEGGGARSQEMLPGLRFLADYPQPKFISPGWSDSVPTHTFNIDFPLLVSLHALCFSESTLFLQESL